MLYEVLIVIFVVNLNTDAEQGVDIRFPGQPGVPVRHADVIRPLILRHVLKDAANIDGDAVANFIKNGSVQPKPASSLARSVLDAPTFSLIARNINQQLLRENLQDEVAQRKKDNPTKRSGSHRRNRRKDYYKNKKDSEFELVDSNVDMEHMSNLNMKAMDLMKQSVYQTRYYLQRTKPFRKLYRDDTTFRIGVLYGSMGINKNKIEALWWEMRKFVPELTKLHMYLLVYERILATHTDITFGMKMMFELLKQFQDTIQDMPDDDEKSTKGLSMIVMPQNGSGAGPYAEFGVTGPQPNIPEKFQSPPPDGKKPIPGPGSRRFMESRGPAYVLTPLP